MEVFDDNNNKKKIPADTFPVFLVHSSYWSSFRSFQEGYGFSCRVVIKARGRITLSE